MGLVTFIRHLGHRDVPLAQAIVDAALTRMRPVLMTARVGEGTRTPDIQIHSLKSESRNVNARKDVTETTPEPLAQTLARQLEKHPDLAHLVERWDTLPEAVRAGIVAMVKAASEG